MAMPQVTRAGAGWTKTITMDKRTQSVVDGLVVTDDFKFTFRGTVQPLSPRAIALKPEGQRAWEWLQVHVFGGWCVKDNDQVIFNGKIYKVMGTTDYCQSGYQEYHLVKDYQ